MDDLFNHVWELSRAAITVAYEQKNIASFRKCEELNAIEFYKSQEANYSHSKWRERGE